MQLSHFISYLMIEIQVQATFFVHIGLPWRRLEFQSLEVRLC